jgi:hypothetical protein
MEGVALYVASIHPATFLPVEYDGKEPPINPPNAIASGEHCADPAPSGSGSIGPHWLAGFSVVRPIQRIRERSSR